MKKNKNFLALALIGMTLSQFGCGGGGGSGGSTGTAPASIAAPSPAAAVSITGLSTSSAPSGAIFAINGSGFQKVNAVSIGSVSVTFTIVSDTQIAITVPVTAVSGVITLSGPGFSVQSSATFVSSMPPPLVTSVSATNVAAGSNFTIQGSNLDRVSGYQIAGANLTVVNSSATSATLTMPAQAISGLLTMIVSGNPVKSAYQINGYLPASIIAILPQLGIVGSSVTINGNGLAAVTSVRFANGTTASVTKSSSTAVTFTVPPGAASGSLTIVDPYQAVQSASAFTVAPIVTATSLLSASSGGTVVLTVTGTNLNTVTAAAVGNTNAAIVSSSNTQLVLNVSLGSSGTLTLTAPEQSINAGTIDSTGNVGLWISNVDFVHVFDKSASDPTLRLTPGRPVLVRATVLAPAAGAKSPAVSLSASSSTGVALGTLAMNGPANLPVAKDDYNLNSSFNAVLPAAWVQPGVKVSIKVAAGVGSSPASQDVSPAIGAATSIRVVLVPLTVGSATGVVPPVLSDVQKALARVYPYANGNIVVQKRSSPLVISGAASTTAMNWGSALTQLESARETEDKNAFYYGFVPMYDPVPGSFVAGLGYVGDRANGGTSPVAAIGLDWTSSAGQGDPFNNNWPQWQAIMVHEMGHNHSLMHAPCGGAAGADPAYPNSTADLSSLPVYNSLYDSDTQIGSLSAPLTPSNTQMKDVMGYCGGTWFSDFSYVRAQQFAESRTAVIPQPLVLTSAASIAAADGYLTISGEITRQGVLLHPALASATKLRLDTATARSTYALRLRTVSGQTYQLPFEPFSVADAADDTSHFWVSLPNPGDIATIDVLHNGQLQSMQQPSQVQRRKAAAAGNAQAMASSVGWTIQNGQLTVTWNAALEPFLSLTYVSPAGTKTVIGNGLENGSATLDIKGLPNGGRFDLSLSSAMQARLVSFPH